MKAHTRAVVVPGGRLREVRCAPPLTLRRVHADAPDVCALCLVSSAAGPLAGDELIAELVVEADAHATLVATGASIAQGRSSQGRGAEPASTAWRVEVGTRASLVADPGPLIVCEGSRVDVEVSITLATDSHLEWRELVVLGRSTDAAPGSATIAWDVIRAGRPLLRQHVDLGDPSRTGGHRVLANVLLTGPCVQARTLVRTRTAVAQRVDEHTVLLTVLGDSAAQVTRDLAVLRAQVGA